MRLSSFLGLPAQLAQFRKTFHLNSSIFIAFLLLALIMASPGTGRVLIANHDGDSISSMDELTGQLSTFIPGGSGGLSSPDSMVLHSEDGVLYISSGQTRDASAILKFDPLNGTFLGRFDHGNSPLFRPYGLAFSPDNKVLFVSSFLSDQILKFDVRTGSYLGVLIQGNGLPGGLNGPNGLLFGPDGFLYCSTEGSIATDGKPVFPGLPSEILRINTTTGESSVFIPEAKVLNASLGYSNYLGLQFGPNGLLYISDFGNDVHIYSFSDGTERGRLLTSWTGAPAKNAIGSLTFNPKGILYVAGFMNSAPGNPGAILRFDANTGKPLPSGGQPGAVFVPPSSALQKPIGILWMPY